MKQYRKIAAALGGIILLGCTAAILPQQRMWTLPAITVSAAEEDYDWSGMLKKSADWFGTSEAVKIADECIQYQVAGEGGWQKGMLTSHTGDWAHSTIDNDATTSQIRFLMRTYAATGQQKYFDCAMRGVDCLFKMQYANGGFMQNLNNAGTYHAHITLNDGAYMHVLTIMQEMSKKSGDFTAVSDAYAKKAAESLEKGIRCLLNMQIKVNGTLTAWCQQHDENTLAPAAARAYELPSICTSESVNVVTFLHAYAKEHPERQDIVQSVNAAIKWFQKSALYGIKFDWNSDKSDKVVTQTSDTAPIWARFYTLDTEVPMFSDRDGGVYYDVAQISQERRTGYAWYGNWGKNVINLELLTEQAAVKPEYQGELIANLLVHDIKNGANWSIQQNLRVGSQIYGDRDHSVVTLPNALAGAEYVQTACDSKNTSGDLAELTAAADCVIYAFVDMRLIEDQGLMPEWLAGWQQRSDIVNSSATVTYEIFERPLNAGETVTLGSNMTGTSVVNYFAAVMPREAETTTEETTTTTAEETTTTTEETTTTAEETTTVTTETTTVTAEPVTTAETAGTTTATTASAESTQPPAAGKTYGDADCSGKVDVSDAVLLARYSLADPDAGISEQGIVNADVNDDGVANTDDVILIVRYIAGLLADFTA